MTNERYVIYMNEKDIPKHCLECQMLNCDDECVLQDEDVNFERDTLDDLYRGCPIENVKKFTDEIERLKSEFQALKDDYHRQTAEILEMKQEKRKLIAAFTKQDEIYQKNLTKVESMAKESERTSTAYDVLDLFYSSSNTDEFVERVHKKFNLRG